MVVQTHTEFKEALARAEAGARRALKRCPCWKRYPLLVSGSGGARDQELRVFSHGGSGVHGNEKAHIEPVSQFLGGAREQ